MSHAVAEDLRRELEERGIRLVRFERQSEWLDDDPQFPQNIWTLRIERGACGAVLPVPESLLGEEAAPCVLADYAERLLEESQGLTSRVRTSPWPESYRIRPEEPMGCRRCGGVYEARFWSLVDLGEPGFPEEVVFCPNCGAHEFIERVVKQYANQS